MFVTIFDPQAGLLSPIVPDAASRRRWGRLAQEGIYSNFGPVFDLSAGGMRIIASRVPKGQFEVEIYSAAQGVRLLAEVSWVRKRGLFRREIGLRFIGVSSETGEVLTTMATMNRYRRSVA